MAEPVVLQLLEKQPHVRRRDTLPWHLKDGEARPEGRHSEQFSHQTDTSSVNDRPIYRACALYDGPRRPAVARTLAGAAERSFRDLNAIPEVPFRFGAHLRLRLHEQHPLAPIQKVAAAHGEARN